MNGRHWLFRSIVTAVAVAITAFGVVATGQVASAAVPDPLPGNAVVSLSVGDVRTGSVSIGPLTGAVFGFFTTNPSDSVNAEGFVTAPPAFTCMSDAVGDCSAQIPIGNAAGQVAQNGRLWAAPISAPAGYFANPQLQTAPLTGGVQANLPVVFQTPPLVAGQTYRSGSTWMTDPGLQTTPQNSTAEFTRRTASDGTFVLSHPNPALPDQCGLNVALVVDLSSSMTAASITQLRTAMDAFVTALRGTPSQAALVTFGTDSPANGFTTSGLQSVATNSDASAFQSRYSNWTTTPTNYTNWDRGFAATASLNNADTSASDHINLAVFLTDGNPTVYGPSPLGTNNQLVDRNSGYTRFREISNGMASANLVKSQSTRVLAVGVGAGVTSVGAGYNLRSISGPTAYNGTNIDTADYMQTTDYGAVSTALRNLVLSACAPSISVVKRIVPFDWDPNGGTSIDSVAYTPPTPWAFTASTATSGASVSGTGTQLTDLATGATAFDVTVPDGGSADFSVAETNQNDPATGDPYTPLPQYTSCVNKSTGVDQPVTVTPGGSDTDFSIPVGFQDVVSCVVYNRATDATRASVLVHKRWKVQTASGTTGYLNGDQPPELEADLALSEPGSPTPLTSQPWGIPRGGFSVTSDVSVGIGETFNNARIPGCTLTSATIAPGNLSADAADTGTALVDGATTEPLAQGTNEWTLTNTVNCVSSLTLLKDVASGTASPDNWVLTAHGPGGALVGPSGVSGTGAATAEVSPDEIYQLGESVNPGVPNSVAATQYYAQTDLRTRPLQFPLSSGSWFCEVTGTAAPRMLSSLGIEGAVTVPLGQSVSCTAENNISTITIIKQVNGGTAQPSDFIFHLEPVDRVGVDVSGIDVQAGPPPDGNTAVLSPLRDYLITELSGPSGYQLTNLTCTSGDITFTNNIVSAQPGGSITCTATNTFSEWTATKSSDPASGSVVQPGSIVTYTVTATLLNGVATSSVSITDDLAGVLNHATFVNGSIHTQAGTATLSGTTLTWDIPSLERTVTLTYQVRIDDDAWSTSFRNSLTTLDSTGGDPAEPCPPTAPDCRTTVVTTPEQPPAPPVAPGGGQGGGAGNAVAPVAPNLPDTGTDIVGGVAAAAVALAAGLLLVGMAIRRRRRHG